MPSFKLKDQSIARKIVLSIVIFTFPIFLLGYFLVVEKQGLIDFTNQEIAGVHYYARHKHHCMRLPRPLLPKTVSARLLLL